MLDVLGLRYGFIRKDQGRGVYRVFVKLKPSKGAPQIDTLDFTKE